MNAIGMTQPRPRVGSTLSFNEIASQDGAFEALDDCGLIPGNPWTSRWPRRSSAGRTDVIVGTDESLARSAGDGVDPRQDL